jgi:DNA-directed RNA polymerase specialized sigma24 family protein
MARRAHPPGDGPSDETLLAGLAVGDERAGVPDDALRHALVSRGRDPCDSALVTDSLGRVRAALGELPRDQRWAVPLAAMYGRSASEIAASESIPLGTAKSRIRMGMAKLRNTVLAEAAS